VGLLCLLCCAVVQVASSRSELMLLLRNMAVGLVPEVLRAADGPPPEAHDFLIRGEGGEGVFCREGGVREGEGCPGGRGTSTGGVCGGGGRVDVVHTAHEAR